MKITIKDLGAGTGQRHGLGRSGKRVSKAAGRTRGQHPRTTMGAMLGGVGRWSDSEALTTSSKTSIWGAGKPTAVRAPTAPRHVPKLSLSMSCSWHFRTTSWGQSKQSTKIRTIYQTIKGKGKGNVPQRLSVAAGCRSLTPGHSSLSPRAHWGSDAWAGSAGYWDELRWGQQAWA